MQLELDSKKVFNSNTLNSNQFNSILIESNKWDYELIKLDSNSIEEKWNANWWRKYWKSAHDGWKTQTLERHKFEKTLFHSSLEWAKQIIIWNYLHDNLRLMGSTIVLPKPTSINHHPWNLIRVSKDVCLPPSNLPNLVMYLVPFESSQWILGWTNMVS